MPEMSREQAFHAMRLFLERNWERVDNMEVRQILSDTQPFTGADGRLSTADPAAIHEWEKCVHEVLARDLQAAE